MCKIISFSGSHGVGKTSLIGLLIRSFGNNPDSYKFFHEINSGLFNIGFNLNGVAYDFDEVVFSQNQAFLLGYNVAKYYLSRTKDSRLVISDRSCVDTYIYTNHFINKNPSIAHKYSDMILDMKHKSDEIMKEVHHILLPPFKDFNKADDRMSMEERDSIWSLFLEYAKSNKSFKYSVLMDPTTQERCNHVINLI